MKNALMIGIVAALCGMWLSEVKVTSAKTVAKGKVYYEPDEEPRSVKVPQAPTPLEEPKSAFEDVEKKSAPPRGDAASKVFQVSAGSSTGCAVAVSPDTLLTVWHVANKGPVTVNVDGQAVPGQATPISGANEGDRDGAIIRTQSGGFANTPVRAPKYHEAVTVYGCRTRKAMRGVVSAHNTVSLDLEESGIDLGDSGGAVFATDGSLVGLVSAYEGDARSMNPPPNQRVVKITRGDLFAPQGGYASARPGSIFDPAPQPQQQFQQYQNGNCAPMMQFGNCAPQVRQYSFAVPVPQMQYQMQYQNGNCAPMQSGNCAPMQGGSYYMRSTPRKTTIKIRG